MVQSAGEGICEKATHIVHQSVEDLLYEGFLADELLLRVDIGLYLLQVPVHHCTLLQCSFIFLWKRKPDMGICLASTVKSLWSMESEDNVV